MERFMIDEWKQELKALKQECQAAKQELNSTRLEADSAKQELNSAKQEAQTLKDTLAETIIQKDNIIAELQAKLAEANKK